MAGLQVSLYKLIDGRWTYINEGFTNPDGRFSKFLERLDFNPGRYKLHYDVDRYFEAKKQDTLYPFIEVVFFVLVLEIEFIKQFVFRLSSIAEHQLNIIMCLFS